MFKNVCFLLDYLLAFINILGLVWHWSHMLLSIIMAPLVPTIQL